MPVDKRKIKKLKSKIAPVLSTPTSFEGCFGWLHRGWRSHGFVICAPPGHEGLVTSRGLRYLSECLGNAGFPVLRFDYWASGDSAGEADEQASLSTWVRDSRLAVHHLKECCGINRVSLLGLRLGATIALIAASELGGLNSVICLEPVISGQRYVRELRAMSRMWWEQASQDPSPPRSHAFIDVAGYRTSTHVLEQLSAIDLGALSSLPGNLAVTLYSRNRAEASAFHKFLIERKLRERSGNFEGVEEFLRLEGTVIPKAFFDNLVQDLVCQDAVSGTTVNPTSALNSRYSQPSGLEGLTETPIRFGKTNLFGMLCRPVKINPQVSSKALVIMNTGALPHTGNGRYSVLLARSLAATGISSLRIDVDGIGESGKLESKVTLEDMYSESACWDVCRAVYELHKIGFSEVSIFGICSGAAIALNSARLINKIDQLFLVNLQFFYLPRESTLTKFGSVGHYTMTSYLRKLARASTWRRLPANKTRYLLGSAALISRIVSEKAAALMGILRNQKSRLCLSDDVEIWLRQLGESGARVNFVYGTADPGLVEFQRRCGMVETSKLLFRNVGLLLLPEADHSFASRVARQLLTDHVCESFSAADKFQRQFHLIEADQKRENAQNTCNNE
ncbi:hydrolase of the alpha/beta superfamily [Burkholderia sp. H160]|nr:hydrolase of the alpha/beta superfamily [Burkholderia sp. H160]